MHLITEVKKNEVFFVLKPTMKNQKNTKAEFLKKFFFGVRNSKINNTHTKI